MPRDGSTAGLWRGDAVDRRGESGGNASISEVRIDGRDAILVSLFLFTEGSRGGEDEERVFYRTLPGP